MLYYNTHKRVQRSKKKDQLFTKKMVLVVPVPKTNCAVLCAYAGVGAVNTLIAAKS